MSVRGMREGLAVLDSMVRKGLSDVASSGKNMLCDLPLVDWNHFANIYFNFMYIFF